MVYVMSKKMYWDSRLNLDNKKRFLSDPELINYINRSFGLMFKIESIRVEG